jgi:hypothetical protein
MTTTAAPLRASSAATGRYDRVFYSGIAIAMALTVLFGFGPTYYFAAFAGRPLATVSGRPITLLVHAHGVLFTSWALLVVAQTTLVAQHKVQVHRRLGAIGGGLAALMIVVGTMTALRSAATGGGPPGTDPLSFLLVPLTDMLLFGSFVGLALRKRGKPEAHKRLMLLAYVSIMAAAVGRLPAVLALGQPPVVLGLTLTFLFAGVAYDLITRRRVHPVYLWGGVVLIASVPFRLVVSQTSAWKAVAAAIVRLV